MRGGGGAGGVEVFGSRCQELVLGKGFALGEAEQLVVAMLEILDWCGAVVIICLSIFKIL